MINISQLINPFARVGDRDLTEKTRIVFRRKYLLLAHMISWQGEKDILSKKALNFWLHY